jgi:hypothetical protein
MSFEPSSLERARSRAAARAIKESRKSIRACYGSASWKTNRSFRPLHAEQLAERGIEIEPLIGGLSRADARAVEQVVIEDNGLENLLNKINSISPNNPIYDQAVQRGREILESLVR